MAEVSVTVTGVPHVVYGPFIATFKLSDTASAVLKNRSGFSVDRVDKGLLRLRDINVTNGTVSELMRTPHMGQSSFSAKITPISAGPVTVSVKFPSSAFSFSSGSGLARLNSGVGSASTTYKPPVQSTVTISGVPSKATGRFLARFVFSEAVTGFTAGSLALTNAAASNIQGSGTTYSAWITPDFKGQGRIKLAAGAVQTGAGVGNAEAVATFGVLLPLTISGVRETAHDPFTVTLTFSSSVRGFGPNAITVENATLSDFKPSGAAYTALITPTAPAAAQAAQPVKVSVAEAAVTGADGLKNHAAGMSFLPIMPAGRPLFPLQLRMLDGAGQAILALDDGKPHTLTLEVQNNDAGDVTLSHLPAGVTAASKDHWHFRLMIREAVLSPSVATAYKTAQVVNGWSIQAEPAPDRLDWMAFHIACTAATGNSLAAGKAISLPLSLVAPRGIGARGTKVELETNAELVKSGDTGLDVRLSHHLLIADAAEARAAARAGLFDVRTTGTHGNRVLCDGKTDNEITLTIKPRPEALADLNNQTWSSFCLQIKAPEDLTIPADGAAANGLKKNTQGDVLEFSLPSDQPQTFTTDTAWTITLTGVKSSGSHATTPGPTAITVTLKNITLAGSIDEVQDVVIEKTPIMVDVSGNVGIGTAKPAASLDVRGDVRIGPSEHHTLSAFSKDGAICANFFAYEGLGGYVGTQTSHPFTIQTAGIDRIKIDTSGKVGIGPITATRANLHVGAVNSFKPATLYKFFETKKEGGPVTNSEAYGYSIWADCFVGTSSGFHVESDARLKELVAHSDGAADLKRLSAIEIVDYRYRDTVQFGRAVHKMVFAQQVEAVLPEAVNRSKGVVPDIMARARAQDGWIALKTDLAAGERVKIVLDDAETILEVLETRADGFRVELDAAVTDVFVYGREVEDLRVVDYDAIAMLNVSATQELSRQMQAKDARIAALEEQVADADNAIESLAIAMRDIMGELTALKKQIAADRR